DAPIAGFAANSFIDMNPVVKVNKVRQVIYPNPIDRLAGSKTGAHRLERGTGIPYLRMAVHAGLSRWDIGKTRSFDCSMTIHTIDPDTAHVMRMAELHRLLDGLRGASGVTGPVQRRKRPR